MNIVLEGPDGAGKSTLANRLLQHLPLTLQQGEGPPKFPGEMTERVKRYLAMDGKLFDRHPCISQPIYDMFRDKKTPIPGDLIDEFYEQGNLLIYVYGRAGPHEVKDHETKEHVEMVERHDDTIRNAYEEWALGYAYIRYSVDTINFDTILKLCQEYLS